MNISSHKILHGMPSGFVDLLVFDLLLRVWSAKPEDPLFEPHGWRCLYTGLFSRYEISIVYLCWHHWLNKTANTETKLNLQEFMKVIFNFLIIPYKSYLGFVICNRFFFHCHFGYLTEKQVALWAPHSGKWSESLMYFRLHFFQFYAQIFQNGSLLCSVYILVNQDR